MYGLSGIMADRAASLMGLSASSQANSCSHTCNIQCLTSRSGQMCALCCMLKGMLTYSTKFAQHTYSTSLLPSCPLLSSWQWLQQTMQQCLQHHALPQDTMKIMMPITAQLKDATYLACHSVFVGLDRGADVAEHNCSDGLDHLHKTACFTLSDC